MFYVLSSTIKMCSFCQNNMNVCNKQTQHNFGITYLLTDLISCHHQLFYQLCMINIIFGLKIIIDWIVIILKTDSHFSCAFCCDLAYIVQHFHVLELLQKKARYYLTVYLKLLKLLKLNHYSF